MTIVVPISQHDVSRVDQWLSCITKFSPLVSHDIILLPAKSVEGKAYEVAGKLSSVGFANSITVHPLYKDPEFGWPIAPNFQWFSAVNHMETKGTPWFWMEVDCLPVRDGWADAIAAAYTSAGAAFMGCVVKTPWKDDNGNIVESLEGPNDKMMCGCGVYPSALRARLDRLAGDGLRSGKDGLLDSLAQGGSSVAIPWDLFMRHAFQRLGMAHTETIGDYWNTINYRLEDGNLLCDPKVTGHDNKPTVVHRHGTINPNNVVIHGCKDDSLATLILAGLDTRTLVRIPKPVEKVEEEVHTNPEIIALRSELAELKDILKTALLAKNPPESGAANGTPPIHASIQNDGPTEGKVSGPNTLPAPAGVSGSRNSISDKAFEYLSSHDKKIRLDQLAGKIDIPINKLKKAIEADDRIEIGKLGWLSIAQEAK